MGEYKKHIEEVERISHQALENQGKIAGMTRELAHENVIEAKRDNDDMKLERSIATRVKAEAAIAESDRLANINLTMPVESSFDFSGIIQMILSALGVGSPLALGAALVMGGKAKRLKAKALHFASQPEVCDVRGDKDLS